MSDLCLIGNVRSYINWVFPLKLSVNSFETAGQLVPHYEDSLTCISSFKGPRSLLLCSLVKSERLLHILKLRYFMASFIWPLPTLSNALAVYSVQECQIEFSYGSMKIILKVVSSKNKLDTTFACILHFHNILYFVEWSFCLLCWPFFGN